MLLIDCEAICKRGSDEKVVRELAAQTGYFPLFGFLSQFNNLIDLASVGLIGTKAGFATSAQEQIKSILNVTAAALTSLSTEAKSSQAMQVQQAEEKRNTKELRAEIKGKLEQEGLKDGRIDTLAGNGAMSELGHGIEKEAGLDALCATYFQSWHFRAQGEAAEWWLVRIASLKPRTSFRKVTRKKPLPASAKICQSSS